MVGTANGSRTPVTPRQAFSVVNGGQDPVLRSGPGSIAGSDCGGIEFTREEVEALLNVKIRTKDKFNLKVVLEKCEMMMDYIKKLRMCVRWFQEFEGELSFEHEKLKKLFESAEKKSNDMEMLMNAKEEELNSIIVELRKNYSLLQEKFMKEETDKLAAIETLMKEKDARMSAERSLASLKEDLEKAVRESSSANQKVDLNPTNSDIIFLSVLCVIEESNMDLFQILSINDMYKRLQEYNTSLQQYNSKLQTELNQTSDTLKTVEREKAALTENLSKLRGYHASQQDQLASTKVSLSILASLEESMKLKEALSSEVGCLRGDLHQVREDRDRQLLLVQDLTAEVLQYKECTGKSAAELGDLTSKSIQLEATCTLQSDTIRRLQEQLAIAEKKLEISDLSSLETRTGYEEQKRLNSELQIRVDEAELKVVEGEALRKKLHNTILELKGNIRVFCRVRPLLLDEGVDNETKIVSFPTTTETVGRGIELVQHGQSHPFMFDKVFTPQSSQEEVFVEISQLVQSALDGYKVCIFAYGQTGSGKTHTMMGTPGSYDEKGLIPRSLEQIFESRQKLLDQGWKYEMQVSMLEIYNENIRDLLASNRSCSTDSGSKQQYAIKHDASGNTHVSDLTIVDVRSSREVSFLLNRAAQSRSVGKTQMNEQSSRSHFVFTLRISGVNESMEQHVQGVLNLIDLAGSERLSKSGSTGDRLKETQAINKSLSSLSDVIFALAKKEEHIPFRNSKLTYLLQPCLGGDSKTLMVVNVSPAPSSVNESLCSLRFAARVNACEISIPRRQTSMRYLEPRLSYG
ncbi:Kinesin, motor domain-containing protein, partial [Cynara cardunculus var. scolymus]